MSIYRLNKELWFPPPSEHEDHGIIAVGGDLSLARLLLAYQQGIFPWYNENEPITWYCPAQRMVLPPAEVRISKSSRNLLNRKKFDIRIDHAFAEVIDRCQKIDRKGQEGTWLNNELKEAMIALHKRGYAHSFEAYEEDQLVGGLYGVSFGGIFCGDSMFSSVSNASKIAFIHLCKHLKAMQFDLIDCQVYNAHLASLGAFEIERKDFLRVVSSSRKRQTLRGNWGELLKSL